MKRNGMLALGVLLLAMFVAGMVMPSPGMTQQAPQAAGAGGKGSEKSYDDWHFMFYVPFWVPAVSGDVGARGKQVNIDIDQIQSWDNLKYLSQVPLAGHFEVQKGPLGLLLDGMWAKYEEDLSGGRQIDIPIYVPIDLPGLGPIDIIRILNGKFKGDITAGAAYSLDEASLFYDVYRCSSRVGSRPDLTLQALAGVRYTYVQSSVEGSVKVTVDTPLGPVTKTVALDKTGTKDWYDPIVGGRLLWNLSDRWMLGFRADVGGFTAASQIQTNLEASVTYRVNDWFFLNAAYRGYYDDYESGSGKDEFKYNVWAYGPWVGFGFQF